MELRGYQREAVDALMEALSPPAVAPDQMPRVMYPAAHWRRQDGDRRRGRGGASCGERRREGGLADASDRAGHAERDEARRGARR